MNGQNTRMNSSVGRATMSEVRSGYCSATVFGASSPSTMWSAVMIANAMVKAIECAVATAIRSPQDARTRLDHAASAGSPIHPRPRLGHRDAELGGRDVAVGVPERAANDAGGGAAFGDELIDARLAHGDERELGRDEEAVAQHQQHDGEQSGEQLRHVRHTDPQCRDCSGLLSSGASAVRPGDC